MTFPTTLPFSMLASYQTGKMRYGEYQLVENKGQDYAFYQKEEGFGFKQGIEIIRQHHVAHKEREIIEVKKLTGNSWGKGSWLVVNTYYFPTMEAALKALKADNAAKGALTPEELNQWAK